jgi:hypothetical protein
MKLRISAILLAIFLAFGSSRAQDTTRVLFLGNSHTYFNDLPQLFADLSESGGHAAMVDSHTPGGYTLEGHSLNYSSLQLIAMGIWDYVVLQENSQYPVINYLRYNSMYPAARLLDSLITFHNGNTTIFLNWGWRYGGQAEVDGYQSPFFVDYFHMQDSMTSACTEIADELEAVLAPIGEAWRTAVTRDPELVLWNPDNYHPALNGSYLAACVFYATYYDESPVGLEFHGGLSDDEALFLQQAAWDTITDIDEDRPHIPSSLELHQNYPNPFNISTTISFTLFEPGEVELTIYNINGQEVAKPAKGLYQPGVNRITWDATDDTGKPVASGVYYYRLRTGDGIEIKRMTLLK